MTKEALEKEAEEWLDNERKYLIEDNEGNLINISKKVKEAYLAGAEPREKQIAELEAQIEKMKKYIKACWIEENLNDYSSYITNTSDEFRDLVEELNEEIRNGR